MLTEKILELVKQGITVNFRPNDFVGPHCAAIHIELHKDNHAITSILAIDALPKDRIDDIIYYNLDKMHAEFACYLKRKGEEKC